MWIQSVVGQNNCLRVLEFRKHFWLEDEIALHAIPFASADAGAVRGGAPGEDTHAGILAVLGEVVVELELLFFAAGVLLLSAAGADFSVDTDTLGLAAGDSDVSGAAASGAGVEASS